MLPAFEADGIPMCYFALRGFIFNFFLCKIQFSFLFNSKNGIPNITTGVTFIEKNNYQKIINGNNWGKLLC